MFSTGVLEAAARGLPAWVDFPDPPAWLREFWDRYGMRHLRRAAHAGARPRPTSSPRVAVAEIVLARRRVTTLCVIPARGGSKGVPRKNLARRAAASR